MMANPSCVPFDHRRWNAWDAVASTISAAPTRRGGAPVTSVAKNGPAVAAQSAIGAANPTSSEVHPESVPQNGCSRSER